ncbi:MAG: AraC family transcriptional regulator [Corallococcus sp.]|nr:AraC family transcriptional regulator [Corallococcus sp.]
MKRDNGFTEFINLLNGIYTSPLTNFCIEVSERYPFYPMRKHEEVILAKVMSGEGTLNANGQTAILTQNDIVVITPFTFHSFANTNDIAFSASAVAVNMRSLLESDGNGNVQSHLLMLNSGQIKSRVIAQTDRCYCDFDGILQNLTEKDDTSNQLVKSEVLRLMYYISNCLETADKPLGSKLAHTMSEALNIVHHQYKRNLDIKYLSEHCGYDEFYVMKLFKSFTLMPFIRYLNNYRLFLAAQALTETPRDICQIAVSAGFNNVSYFNRQFLHLYKMTPTQYRIAYSQNYSDAKSVYIY